eukprot:TRINITY_DN381_c0_g1_i4.p1 TRINITY_DN381_c0_g1~~TRINITY_DN381_c0_g1_i4.p1  ORF type:complete len:358 (+),score=62.72 TRINITY_DN381_c0_g1_i4:178-1251(+)
MEHGNRTMQRRTSGSRRMGLKERLGRDLDPVERALDMVDAAMGTMRGHGKMQLDDGGIILQERLAMGGDPDPGTEYDAALPAEDHELPAQVARHRWLQSKRPPISSARLCFAIGFPIAVVFVVAIVTGLSVNAAFTGDALHGGQGTVPSEQLAWVSTTPITLNALEQGCACAAIATGMGLVRFGFRNYTHPRVYGVFSFVAYLALLMALLGLVYSGSDITVLTDPQANAFGNQIYSFLGANFKWEDQKFPTSFGDIAQLSDFWDFMRGPFHDFLLGTAINQQSLIDGTDGELINAPAMAAFPSDYRAAMEDGGVAKGTFPWIVSFCNMRQVIRNFKTTDVSSMLGNRQVATMRGSTY